MKRMLPPGNKLIIFFLNRSVGHILTRQIINSAAKEKLSSVRLNSFSYNLFVLQCFSQYGAGSKQQLKYLYILSDVISCTEHQGLSFTFLTGYKFVTKANHIRQNHK